MGRHKEIGLSYFPFDVDTFSDIKIRKLIKYQGGKAVTVYALLLCLIYKGGYYMRWDNELPFVISEQTGFDEAYIQEVINSCLALGLFSKTLFDSDRVLTSKGIQVRYAEAMNFFRRKSEICAFNLISSEENGISSAFMPINAAKTPRKERKEKEIKKETDYVGKESQQEQPKQQVESKNLKKSFDENVKICLASPQWQENVQIVLGVRSIDWRSAFEKFRASLVANGHDMEKSSADFKMHFMNWLRIQINENGRQESMGGYDRKGSRQGISRTEIAPAAVVPATRGKSVI